MMTAMKTAHGPMSNFQFVSNVRLQLPVPMSASQAWAVLAWLCIAHSLNAVPILHKDSAEHASPNALPCLLKASWQHMLSGQRMIIVFP